jgi:hypothetical protein
MHGTRVVSLRGAMSRFAVAAIAVSLTSVIPARAERPISLRDMSSFRVREVDISGKLDKQVPFMGSVPIRVDQRAGYWFEQMYVLPEAENRRRDLVVLTAGGHRIFLVCIWGGGTSF